MAPGPCIVSQQTRRCGVSDLRPKPCDHSSLAYIVVGKTFFRENRPDSQIFAVLIRRASLFDDIRTEAETLIDPEDTSYAADHATDRPARTSRPFTVLCTPLDAAANALGVKLQREEIPRRQ